MDPSLAAALLDDRGESAILLQARGVRVERAVLAKSDQQPGLERFAGARQVPEEIRLAVLLEEGLALPLDQLDVLGQRAQLFEQSRQVQARRHQHRLIGGEGAGLLDQRQTVRDQSVPSGPRADSRNS